MALNVSTWTVVNFFFFLSPLTRKNVIRINFILQVCYQQTRNLILADFVSQRLIKKFKQSGGLGEEAVSVAGGFGAQSVAPSRGEKFEKFVCWV